jgi:glycosyltransferase involved in cell wall biosynthesis
MKLSIITINYNDANGLQKTIESVLAQTYSNIEYIIVDGASTDGSVDVIRELATRPTIKWVSEKDTGIYNAMNKGIRMATGEYIQILNSGDILAAPDVTERMFQAMGNGQWAIDYETNRQSPIANRPQIPIFYGNMIKVNAAGKVVGKSGYTEYSLRQFYSSTLNHDCAYIRKDLFEEYGLYDENLKIVSDWKWYLQAIGLGRVKPVYVDIDVTIFDDGGISETNLALRNKERRQVLEELMPPAILWDYDTHAFEMEQMKRLRRWKMYGLVYLLERTLFKLEKWGVLRR